MTEQSIIHLVDSLEYVNTNCHQHQLMYNLASKAREEGVRINTVPLNMLASTLTGRQPIICCLKQRTLHAHLDTIAMLVNDVPFVIYDQDPWQAFMDDSLYKGIYNRACKRLNVKTIAVTTQSWAEHIVKCGMPGMFVNMWIMPEYCKRGPTFEDRAIKLGFVGSLHSYRQDLFNRLDDVGISVNVQSGNTLPYRDYLKAVSNIKVFIHSEDSSLNVDGEKMNLRDGLWMREIEVASQGCFSIRNTGSGSESYVSGLPTVDGKSIVRLYEHPEDVIGILDDIEKMDVVARQNLLDGTVEYIRQANKWQETATTLIKTAMCVKET